MEVRKYIDSAVRGTTATLLGTAALGQSKDAGYLKNALTEIPFYGDAPIAGSVLEGAGNFAAQHQNPTVAFLGLSAIAIAVNRGALLNLAWLNRSNSSQSKVGMNKIAARPKTAVNNTQQAVNPAVSPEVSAGIAELVMGGAYIEHLEALGLDDESIEGEFREGL